LTLANIPLGNKRKICKDCLNQQGCDHRTKIKKEVIDSYGGHCVCCNESNIAFLNIDHINGDGAEHRKTNPDLTGVKIYLWLKQNAFPTDNFRVLCWNCNQSFGHHNYCPHNEETIITVKKPVALQEFTRRNYKLGETRFCRYCATKLILDQNWYASCAKYCLYTCMDCQDTFNLYNRQALKKETFNAYGGQKCQCCGETHMELLSLDHIYGDGKQHYKLFDERGGHNFYRKLKQAGYPDKHKLRVLCFNCNCARSICSDGTCPHEEERQKQQEETHSLIESI
jgi:hypothetical protein